MRSKSVLVGLAAAALGVTSCTNASPPLKRRVAERAPPVVVVAADRFTTRVDDAALREHVAGARTLSEALEWTVPRMGDAFLADRMFAARDIPMIGGELLASWADAHLRWEDVSTPRELDLRHVSLDAAPFRGLVVCARGDMAPLDASKPREVVFVTRDDGAVLAHLAHLAGPIPEHRVDVLFCGVIVGRRVVGDGERRGLILTGMVRDEPAPEVQEPPVDELFEELLGEPDAPTFTL